MPSSDYTSIPKVLRIVEAIQPRWVLDVGAGHGRYGFLMREVLDWNYGRLNPADHQIRIDAVEIEAEYVRPYHRQIYDDVMIGSWLDPKVPNGRHYDLIFMGDVLEHFAEGDWQVALGKARSLSDFTLIVCPNHKRSMAQGAWLGFENERHRVLLSPETVGGRCLFANSKMFMCAFDNHGIGILDDKDVCP